MDAATVTVDVEHVCVDVDAVYVVTHDRDMDVEFDVDVEYERMTDVDRPVYEHDNDVMVDDVTRVVYVMSHHSGVLNTTGTAGPACGWPFVSPVLA